MRKTCRKTFVTFWVGALSWLMGKRRARLEVFKTCVQNILQTPLLHYSKFRDIKTDL